MGAKIIQLNPKDEFKLKRAQRDQLRRLQERYGELYDPDWAELYDRHMSPLEEEVLNGEFDEESST